ncbi:hypothetical protein BO71DRAFT_287176, partial [Aspergillus ellipticus CBS 707.79]
RTVHMIDTPGFDNPTQSDLEVLRQITQWLSESQIQLNGVIYCHRIMSATSVSNLQVIRKMCGDSNLPALALITTFWDLVDTDEGGERQKTLESTPHFWKELIERGSQPFSCDDDRSTALEPVEYIIKRNQAVRLQIQTEMGDPARLLEQTAAGKEIQGMDIAQLKRDMELMRRQNEEERERL